jgi:hypothetical protein
MKKIFLVLEVILILVTYVFSPCPSTVQAQGKNISWECSLYGNETSGKVDYVVFGEAPDANDGSPADGYDVAKPPTPVAPYLRVHLKDNLPAPYTSLWRDYRRYSDSSKVWNLTIQWVPADEESSTDVILTWDPAKVDASEYSTVSLSTNTGIFLKNMLIDTIYRFSCPALLPQNFKIICTRSNTPPRTPNSPTGETTGYHGTTYNYSTSSTDPDGDNLYYQFNWGNNVMSNWLGPYESGELISISYAWPIPGFYSVKTHVKDIYGDQSNWSSTLLVEMLNRAPSQPSYPSPQNGGSYVQTTPILSWMGDDPDGDLVTFDVYFGTSNPPPKLIDNQSSSLFNPGTLAYQTTYYWRILSWDGFGGRTSGPVWSFTTTASDNGSSESPNGDSNHTNQPPVADASLSQQTGFVDTMLFFNGSRSYDVDGYLTKWVWEFGDGSTGTGERTTHMYQTLGVYFVTLTVTDDTGATGTDMISVEVGSANRPPARPVINGAQKGVKNKNYTYTIYSTDTDNDFLQYIVDWGDGMQNTSVFLPNGTIWSLSHSWSASGKYEILVKATDNTTFSEPTTRRIFIDVSFVNTLGFLFDKDNDGQDDAFYINKTGGITNAQRLTKGTYLLDTDNDGKWNYQYDPATGSLTPIESTIATLENQWFFILIIGVAIIIIAAIVYLYKKNYF